MNTTEALLRAGATLGSTATKLAELERLIEEEREEIVHPATKDIEIFQRKIHKQEVLLNQIRNTLDVMSSIDGVVFHGH